MLEVGEVPAVDPVHSSVVRHPVQHHSAMSERQLGLSTTTNYSVTLETEILVRQSSPLSLDIELVQGCYAVVLHQNKVTTHSSHKFY